MELGVDESNGFLIVFDKVWWMVESYNLEKIFGGDFWKLVCEMTSKFHLEFSSSI